VISLGKKKKGRAGAADDLRLSPEKRLAARFDAASIKKFEAPDREDMGFRVLDNCAEENQK